MRFAIIPLLSLSAFAAEPTGTATAPAAVPTGPDPTMAIVAEGRYLYRQRDLDALLAIAKRHAGKQWTGIDETAAAQAIVACLRTREDFVIALGSLPQGLRGRARDALILDLLSYEADPSAKTQTPASSSTASVATTNAGPVVVRLPQPLVRRTVGGKPRALAVGVALSFPDAATAKMHESQAPVLQDALLSAIYALTDAQFVNPDHAALKDAIERAFRTRVPTLPAGCVLIPALDARDDSGG